MDDEELTPFYLGVAEPPGGFKNVFPRNTQIVGYDAVRVEPPEEPPWVPMRDIISRAPMCRCPVLPVEGEYCNVCENFPCLGGHPPVD